MLTFFVSIDLLEKSTTCETLSTGFKREAVSLGKGPKMKEDESPITQCWD